MCEKCEGTSCILTHDYKGNAVPFFFADLRMDLENNQLDIQYGALDESRENKIEEDWSGSVDISVCPFCGTRLPITLPIEGFIETFMEFEGELSDEMNLVLTHMRKMNECSLQVDPIIKRISEYYNTNVTNFVKHYEFVTIYFEESKFKNLHL